MMTSGELAIRHFCRDGRGLVRAERGPDPAARPTPGRRSPPRGRVRAPAGRPAPPRGGLQQPEHPPGLTPGRSAASTSSSPARRSRKGYRQHSCGNTLQGLSASPRVAPEPAAGRGRTAPVPDAPVSRARRPARDPPGGLALSPWSVFPHECCRYPRRARLGRPTTDGRHGRGGRRQGSGRRARRLRLGAWATPPAAEPRPPGGFDGRGRRRALERGASSRGNAG